MIACILKGNGKVPLRTQKLVEKAIAPLLQVHFRYASFGVRDFAYFFEVDSCPDDGQKDVLRAEILRLLREAGILFSVNHKKICLACHANKEPDSGGYICPSCAEVRSQ